MVMRIFFDDEPVPHVEAPVGDFFGVMHGQDWYPIDNHFLSIKAWNGYNCYFPMRSPEEPGSISKVQAKRTRPSSRSTGSVTRRRS